MRTLIVVALAAYALLIAWGFTTASAAELQRGPAALRLLAGHQVNITARPGLFPRSGEVVVFDGKADGRIAPGGGFLAEDWQAAEKAFLPD